MEIDNHQLITITLATIEWVYHSQLGLTILIFNQYIQYGKSKLIHLPVHLISFRNNINDRLIKTGW